MRTMQLKTKKTMPELKENIEPKIKDVNRQEHYTQHEIQVIEFCERNKLGWCASNVVKYVCRENKKRGLEDLEKAMSYLKCLIQYKRTGIFLTPDKIK